MRKWIGLGLALFLILAFASIRVYSPPPGQPPSIGDKEYLDATQEDEAEIQVSSETLYVGSLDGRIAIFRGRPENGKLEILTEVPVPPGEEERLRVGIPAEDYDEVTLILDGLLPEGAH